MLAIKVFFCRFSIFLWVFLLTSLVLIFARQIFEWDIPLLEQIVIVAILVSVLVKLIISMLQERIWLNYFRAVTLESIVIGFLLTILLLSNTLINIDRSRSFYVISWVNNGSVRLVDNELKLSVNSSEAADIAAISMRLDEQVERGLLLKRGNTFEISGRGRLTLKIANTLAYLFDLENWKFNKY